MSRSLGADSIASIDIQTVRITIKEPENRWLKCGMIKYVPNETFSVEIGIPFTLEGISLLASDEFLVKDLP